MLEPTTSLKRLHLSHQRPTHSTSPSAALTPPDRERSETPVFPGVPFSLLQANVGGVGPSLSRDLREPPPFCMAARSGLQQSLARPLVLTWTASRLEICCTFSEIAAQLSLWNTGLWAVQIGPPPEMRKSPLLRFTTLRGLLLPKIVYPPFPSLQPRRGNIAEIEIIMRSPGLRSFFRLLGPPGEGVPLPWSIKSFFPCAFDDVR